MQSPWAKKRQQRLSAAARRVTSDLELLVGELERLRPDLLEKAAPPQRFRNWGVLFGASIALGAVGAVIVRRILEQTAIDGPARAEEAVAASHQPWSADHS